MIEVLGYRTFVSDQTTCRINPLAYFGWQQLSMVSVSKPFAVSAMFLARETTDQTGEILHGKQVLSHVLRIEIKDTSEIQEKRLCRKRTMKGKDKSSTIYPLSKDSNFPPVAHEDIHFNKPIYLYGDFRIIVFATQDYHSII